MGRAQFKQQLQIPINDIYLDIINPRIRSADSQRDCIERVLRKDEQMLNLMKSIASEGLTTAPILICPHPTESKKWIVKDGNRRIAALKLLNDPSLCSDIKLRNQITAIRDEHATNIVDKIDCQSSDDPQAMINEIVHRHSGAMKGAGQLNWSAYLKSVFQLNNELHVDYKRATQFLFWAEAHNIYIDDDFPITNVQRFFNAYNLALMGFTIENDDIEPALPLETVIKIANKVINDFASSSIKVNDIFTPAQAEEYLTAVRNQLGIIVERNNGEDSNEGTAEPSSNHESTTDQASGPSSSENPEPEQESNPRPARPTKPVWDRKKLFWAGSPAPAIPLMEVKARSVLLEISKLDVKNHPIAAFMLMRALIELSVNHYRSNKGLQDKGALAKNTLASAQQMLSDSILDKSLYELIQAFTNTDKAQVSIFNIDTMQKFIHRETHIPDYSTLNIFWDQIHKFVQLCWQK